LETVHIATTQDSNQLLCFAVIHACTVYIHTCHGTLHHCLGVSIALYLYELQSTQQIKGLLVVAYPTMNA